MFWILFLLFASLSGENAPSAMAHFESGLPGIAGGYVNVITGVPFVQSNDLVIPGIEPLIISKSFRYDPEVKHTAGWDIHLSECLKRRVDEEGGVHFIHVVDYQPMFFFKIPKERSYNGYNRGCRRALSMDYSQGPLFYEDQKGGTNIGHGYPTGRYALKNTRLEKNNTLKKDEFSTVMTSGSGEKRIFFEEEMRNGIGFHATLKELRKPNGFHHHFLRKDHSTTGITITSPTGEKTASIDVHYIKDVPYPKIGVWAADGRHSAFTYKDNKLLVMDSSDHPQVRYGYIESQLETISLPDQRGIKFSYWKEKDYAIDREGKQKKLGETDDVVQKVKTIEQPVGATSEKLTTHLFEYFHFFNKDRNYETITRVNLFEGHFDEYSIDHNFRIKEISYYTNPEKAERVTFPTYPLKQVCDFKEQFDWSKAGEIKEKRHCDGNGKPLQKVRYAYDDRGNVLKETFIGDITGKGKNDSYVKICTYSNDGFNLLLSERLPSGLEVRYEYKLGTNLLTKRTMLSGEEIYKEENFEYDDDHCLIRSDEKTALTHRVEKITPSKKTPFGYPIEKKIFAVGLDGEELQESYHYRYNTRGDIVFEERRDRNGQLIFSVEKTFDGHGNCTEELDSFDRCVTRKFDKNDNCIEEIGPRPGFVKKFCYDFMNRCTQGAISYGGETWVTDHAYNKLNQRIKTTNYLGHTTEVAYDRYGRPIKISLPKVLVEDVWERPVFRKKYDIFGNEIESTDALNRTTISKFTARNKPYEVIHLDGSKQSIVYSLESLPIQITDEDGVVTTFTYDGLGRPLSKRTAHGEETYRYVGLHLVEKIDMEGVSTHYCYDALGRPIEIKTGKRREVIAYDEMGHPYWKARYEDETLLSIEISHIDALGRTIESYLEDPSGDIFNHKYFVYDAVGNCIEEKNGRSTTTKVFDGLNRVIRAIDEQGNTHQVFYRRVQHEGQLVEEKTVVDPNGQQSITLFDALGKESIIRHLNPFGIEIYRKEISYDLAGQVIKETVFSETDQRILLKTYDTRGRVVTLTEPLKKVTHMSYTPSGKLKVLCKPDGVKLIHEYLEGRLHALKSSDDRLHYTYHYNKRGELIEVVDQLTGLKSLQVFSPLGELEQEILPTGEMISYTYDGLGRMTSYSLPDGGQAVLSYNARAATSVSRLDAHQHELYRHSYTQFDDLGNVIEEMLIGKGGKVTTSFDSLYQLTSIEHHHLTQKNLLYDPAGNLSSFEKNGELFSFQYDDLYQLTKEKEHSYTYDAFYNRTSKNNESYELNELNQLLADRDTTYTYDPNGNLLQLEDHHRKLIFSYDPLNRLISIDNGQEHVTFTYDAFHRRLTRNGIPFHFCREQEIGFENSLRLLGPGLGADIGAAIAIELDGVSFAPLHDHQGSIIGLVDLEGNLQASWDYTAYGELIGECASPWGFASKRQEPLTGWISFGRRDYDAATGRWTTPDPLGFDAGPNLYTYVSNRPLTHRDPLGLMEETIRTIQKHQSSRMDGGGYSHRDSTWELTKDAMISTLKEYVVDAFYYLGNTKEILAGTLYQEHAFNYPRGMYIKEYCDLEKLPPGSTVAVHTNGIGVSPEEFEKNCQTLVDLGFNVVGIYNPYHGEGFINLCRDALRAYGGIKGQTSRQLVIQYQKSLETIMKKAPNDTKFILNPHSEGNVLVGNALRGYEYGRDRLAYLGVGPAAYVLDGLAGIEYGFITTSLDMVPRLDSLGRKDVPSNRIIIANSPWERLWSSDPLDHSFQSPTILLNLQRGIESYSKTGKISFE